MDEYERSKGWIAIKIDDQEQVHVIGHDHRIGSGERGIEYVQMPPERNNAFTSRRGNRTAFLINDARENLPSPFYA